MSFNVLRGGTHTYYDDIESFLYVLLLFFSSYAPPPPSKEELLAADTQGFVHPLGSGRLAHMRRWPADYTSKDSDLNSENGGLELVRSAHVWPRTGLERSYKMLTCSFWLNVGRCSSTVDAVLLLG